MIDTHLLPPLLYVWHNQSHLLLASASEGHALPAVSQWDCCRSSTLCISADERDETNGDRIISGFSVCGPCRSAFCALICLRTHSEVEALSLLLIGSSLTDVCLAHVGVRGSGFDRLCGLAVLEGLWHIEVLHCEHVLEGLHGRVEGLPHLTHTHSRQTQPKLRFQITFLLNIFIWNLYASKQLKDVVILPDVHIYKYILVSQTSWVVQTGLNHWGPSAQHFDWHTANNGVISFLAWSIVTWKINYVPSMCGRQAGSTHILIHDWLALTHIHTQVTFKHIHVSHSGLGDPACWSAPPPTSGHRGRPHRSVSDYVKMNMLGDSSEDWFVLVACYCDRRVGCWLPIPVQKPMELLKTLQELIVKTNSSLMRHKL